MDAKTVGHVVDADRVLRQALANLAHAHLVVAAGWWVLLMLLILLLLMLVNVVVNVVVVSVVVVVMCVCVCVRNMNSKGW